MARRAWWHLNTTTPRPLHGFLSRCALAFLPAFALVNLAMIAVSGEGYEWINLVAGTALTVPIALGAAVLSAAFIRNVGIALVLWTQLLTVVSIGLVNFLL